MSPRVLFFAPYGSWLKHNQVDAVLALALRVRGAEVQVVLCDGVFKDNCYLLGHKRDNSDCERCAASGKSFFSGMGLPTVQLREYIRPEDYLEINAWAQTVTPEHYTSAEFQGLPIGKWITPTVCSYHAVSTRGLGEEGPQYTFRQYLRYAPLAHRAVSRIFDDFKPTHFVTFSGKGFIHSPACAVAEERGVKILTHEMGYAVGSFMFASDTSVVELTPRREVLEEWLKVPFTTEEAERSIALLSDWEKGRSRSMGKFYQYQIDPSEVRKKLGIPPDARVMGVFTSGEHEANYVEEWKVVENQLTIVERLIEIFSTRDEYLVIRHHPNVGDVKNGYVDHEYLSIAYEQAKRLPKNVRVIMPHEKITAYALLWNLDAAMAFVSTVGLEAIARAIPCASFDISLFSPIMTTTITGKTTEGLERVVENLFRKVGSITSHEVARAHRLASTLYFHFSSIFKSFTVKPPDDPLIQITSLEELLPGNDPPLDRVCNHLLTGSSVYELPAPHDYGRSPVDEDRVFDAEVQRLNTMKRDYRASNAVAYQTFNQEGVAVIEFFKEGIQRTDFSRQRYQNLTTYLLGQGSHSDERSVLHALRGFVRSLSEERVLIACDQMQYDESFVLASIELLWAHPETSGVFWGAWIKDMQGIKEQIFTVRNPFKLFERVIEAVAEFATIQPLLGLTLFKREFLVQVLDLLLESESPSKTLFEMLHSEQVLQTEIPMAVLLVKEKEWSPPQELFSLFPKHNKPTTTLAQQLDLAVKKLDQYESQGALDVLEQIIVSHGANAPILCAKAVAEARLGSYLQAETSLKQALALDNNNKTAIDLLVQLQEVAPREELPSQKKQLPEQPSCLFLNTYYNKFLEQIYGANPRLLSASYAEQQAFLVMQAFGDSDFYSRGLTNAGWRTEDIIINCAPLQARWALENRSARHGWDLVLEQVEKFRPDIVYCQDMPAMSQEMLRSLKPFTKFVVGQIACPFEVLPVEEYDIVISSIPYLVDLFREYKIPSYYVPLAFERELSSSIPYRERPIECSFVGGMTPSHPKRFELLNALASEFPIEFWGYGIESVPADSPLHTLYKGEAWGRGMFEILGASKVTLNCHISINHRGKLRDKDANNMRLFEATGCGALLITDYRDNLNDLFEIGKEVVAYRSIEECGALVRYYLTHPEEAEKIARAGQARTLRDHSYEQRMMDLAEILGRHLTTRERKAAFTKPDLERISYGHTPIEKEEVKADLCTAWKDAGIPALQRALVEDQLSEMYRGTVAGPFAALADTLKSVIRPQSKVLEIGCASGYYYEILEYLLKTKLDYTGVDYSDAMIEMAQELYPRAKFYAADGAKLPFKNREFEIAISSCVILHTPNFEDHIRETVRVADKYVVFHRTPVMRNKPTQFFKKHAYGVETVEIHFNEIEFLHYVKKEGLVLKNTLEVESNPAKDEYSVSYLFERITLR